MPSSTNQRIFQCVIFVRMLFSRHVVREAGCLKSTQAHCALDLDSLAEERVGPGMSGRPITIINRRRGCYWCCLSKFAGIRRTGKASRELSYTSTLQPTIFYHRDPMKFCLILFRRSRGTLGVNFRFLLYVVGIIL